MKIGDTVYRVVWDGAECRLETLTVLAEGKRGWHRMRKSDGLTCNVQGVKTFCDRDRAIVDAIQNLPATFYRKWDLQADGVASLLRLIRSTGNESKPQPNVTVAGKPIRSAKLVGHRVVVVRQGSAV